MRRIGLLAPFALALGLGAALPKKPTALPQPVAKPRVMAQPKAAPIPSAPPRIALLFTGAPEGDETTLVFQRPGEEPHQEGVTSFRHLPGGGVKGAVAHEGEVVFAIADVEKKRDPSWGAALFRLEAGREPITLADRVYTNTRPLVLEDGSVLVQRGREGEEPSEEESLEGRLRVDAITIDRIDPLTGTSRTLHQFSGYIAFLAGALDNEALVYRVAPDNADIVAIDVNDGRVRALAPSILPFARDFSVDEANRSLFFTERDERNSQIWAVSRMNLATGARTRIVSGRRMALVPHAFPGGGVAFNPDGERGLTILQASGRVQSLRPLGDGVDTVRGLSRDGKWAAVMHSLPSQLPTPYLFSLETHQPVPISAPESARVDIAGFVR